MTLRTLRFSLPAFLAAAVVACLLAVPARAQRLLFQRGGALYSADLAGADPRKLFDVGGEPGTLWAASPDGHRIAWLKRPLPTGTAITPDLRSRPASVFVGDLTGRRQKRLFTTDDLRDRQNKKVTAVGADLPASIEDEKASRRFDGWEPVSLSWSADGRTLYVGCRLLPPAAPVRATFLADGATGAAVVDADGRWKALAPVTDVDASGAALVGVGTGEVTAADGGVAARYSPLVLLNLVGGSRTILFAPQAADANLPDYALAQSPALSGNDNRYVAFTSANKGLWLLDRTQGQYRQLLDRNVQHPRWAPYARSVFFLEARPQPNGTVTSDLYAATFAPATGEIAIPTPLLQDVSGFDIVPD